MSNWIKNTVRIAGPAEDISALMDLVRSTNSDGSEIIDFNKIIPMPERLNIVAGGYAKYYVALYLETLNKAETRRLREMLTAREVSFYGNYYEKFKDSFDMWLTFPDDELKRMRRTFKNEYKQISPATMEDVGKAYIDNILEYGHDTWYEWCCHNWGTKWNACECEIGKDYLIFHTAWDAPFPIINELSKRFPRLTFDHKWVDIG